MTSQGARVGHGEDSKALSQMRGRLALLLAAMAAFAVACGSGGQATGSDQGIRKVTVDGGSNTEVSPARLTEMLLHKDFLLVNVHVPHDADIPDTDTWLPFNDADAMERRLPDKTAKVVLYCNSGRMSDIAARALVREGYTNVWDLGGGMTAWQEAGYSLLASAASGMTPGAGGSTPPR